MKRFLFGIVGPMALLAGVGGAMILMRRRRKMRWEAQPDLPMPPGMPQYESDQQVEPYYGGDQLGQTEPTGVADR